MSPSLALREGLLCGGKQTLDYVGAGVAIGSWIYSLIDASAGPHRHNRDLGFELRVALLMLAQAEAARKPPWGRDWTR